MVEEITRYKIITSKNKEQLTEEIIRQMSLMNTIDKYSVKKTIDFLNKELKTKEFMLGLIFLGKEIAGFTYGNLKDNTFFLNRFFVRPKLQGRGFGTKLIGHFWGHLRHEHKVETIKMTAFLGTHEINKKLTGQKEMKLIIEKPDPKDSNKTIKKVIAGFRNFNNSSFIYCLASKPIKEKRNGKFTINPYKTDDRIHINSNPLNKKKLTRSRAK